MSPSEWMTRQTEGGGVGVEEASLSGSRLARCFEDADGKTPILRDVSIDLLPGQVTLLMGPSGSGKSTLLAVLSGLLRPDEGQVLALGEDLWAMGEAEREHFRLRHFGIIFPGYNLFPALTAVQQLEMVMRWGQGATHRQARRKAEEMLSLLGLGPNKWRLRPAQLSGGEKQRVAIGRALCKDPQFCFADEPTSALDWAHGKEVIELLCNAAHDRGATILIVAHDERIKPFADRVLHLDEGRLKDEGHEGHGLSVHEQF
jgi:putative ABC transport system ATP-binding protein